MDIRKATVDDIKGIHKLLCYVLEVHHNIRKDLFKEKASKYTIDELTKLLDDDKYAIFVSLDNGLVNGYVFTILEAIKNDNILNDTKTLYIDDLCVDPNFQHQHIGKKLLEKAMSYAKELNCYHVTLNVWEGNESAKQFYKNVGFKPYKYNLEYILDKEEQNG